jgi:hypothetical protein
MGRKVSYYVDEHVGKAVVKGLRQRGLEAIPLAPDASQVLSAIAASGRRDGRASAT